MKKYIYLILILSVSLFGGDKKIATTDSGNINIIKEYLNGLYSVDDPHSLILGTRDIIISEILFYNPIIDNHMNCSAGCDTGIFNIDDKADDVVSAMYNFDKDKGLTSLSFENWKSKNHISASSIATHIKENIKKVTYDSTGNLRLDLKNLDSADLPDNSLIITVANGKAASINFIQYNDDYARQINVSWAESGGDANYTVKGYSCLASAQDCIKDSGDKIGSSNLKLHTDISFIISKADGSISKASGKLYYYVKSSEDSNTFLHSYWGNSITGQEFVMKKFSSETMGAGDYIEIGSGQGQLKIWQ